MLGKKLVTKLGKAVAAGALLSGAVLAFGGAATAAPTAPEGPGPWYVNAATGNDTNSCLSPTQACRTIKVALLDEGQGNPGTPAQDTINVAAGVYLEPASANAVPTTTAAGPINIVDAGGVDNTGVSIVGVGQSFKKKKHGTIVAPEAPSCASGPGGLINVGATNVTISNLAVSGGNCSGQTSGIDVQPGNSATVTDVTILSGADFGINAAAFQPPAGPLAAVTLNASSDTIGSATSCSTTATETSSGNIITVAKIPKCAKSFTAVTVGDSSTPNQSAAFKLSKTEVQTTTALSVDNGDTVFFNTTPFGYSEAGVNCQGSQGGPGAQCNVSNSDIIGGGTFVSGSDGISITGDAGANVYGNTITGNADSTAPTGSNFGESAGVLIIPSTGNASVNIGNSVAKDGNKFSGNDNGVGVFGGGTGTGQRQSVTVDNNDITSGSANKGIGIAALGIVTTATTIDGIPANDQNVQSLDILHNTVSQGVQNTGGGIGLIGSDGVTVGGTDSSGPSGNDVTGNGLGIYITSIPTLSLTLKGVTENITGCQIGSNFNNVTNNTVTNNTLFGIDVDGVASLPELVSENVCAFDLNGANNISANVALNNGTFANAEGVNGADFVDFGIFTTPKFPAQATPPPAYPPYRFTLAAGDQIAGCTGETPCTFSAQVYDVGALSPGEKIPEGTKFVLGTCIAGVSGSCMTAFTAATGSGFQTISNNPLAPSTLDFTSEAGALSSLTTPITAPSTGLQFTSTPVADQTYAADELLPVGPNTYAADVCTNGDGGPGTQLNTLTSNQESDSAVLNAVTGTAAYDAC